MENKSLRKSGVSGLVKYTHHGLIVSLLLNGILILLLITNTEITTATTSSFIQPSSEIAPVANSQIETSKLAELMQLKSVFLDNIYVTENGYWQQNANIAKAKFDLAVFNAMPDIRKTVNLSR